MDEKKLHEAMDDIVTLLEDVPELLKGGDPLAFARHVSELRQNVAEAFDAPALPVSEEAFEVAVNATGLV